jgi:hypothetical protein
MAILTKRPNQPILVDLTGPHGNAFAMLSLAASLSKQFGLDADKVKAEMMAGDYKHLITTFDGYFGSVVNLFTDKEL